MDFKIKHFNELSTYDLYELLQLRIEVFVVEQNCPYQDLDNKDQHSYHVLGTRKINCSDTSGSTQNFL
jgi:ElaA protein